MCQNETKQKEKGVTSSATMWRCPLQSSFSFLPATLLTKLSVSKALEWIFHPLLHLGTFPFLEVKL